MFLGRYVCFAVLFLLIMTGCSFSVPDFGKRFSSYAKVRITSSPGGIQYYLLTLAQNRELKGRLAPISRTDIPSELLNYRNVRTADPHWRHLAIGEYVLLLNCGEVFQRQRIHIIDGLEKEISCANV